MKHQGGCHIMSNNISGAHFSRTNQANLPKGVNFGRFSNAVNRDEESKTSAKQDDDSVTLDMSRHARNAILNMQLQISEEPMIFVAESNANPDSSKLRFADAQYYKHLFMADIDEVNENFGTSHVWKGMDAYNVDLSVARYNELREQVISEFSHDEKLLEANLNALDEGFMRHLDHLAASEAALLWLDQVRHQAAQRGTPSPIDNHPLATHKDFNHKVFRENTMNLLRDFATQYIQQINNNGGDFKSAWNSTLEVLNSTETTSVNSLSFNDFMIFQSSKWYREFAEEGVTMMQLQARHGNLHDAFRNNPNLSENLKNILGFA
jgi:hypothetical protein